MTIAGGLRARSQGGSGREQRRGKLGARHARTLTERDYPLDAAQVGASWVAKDAEKQGQEAVRAACLRSPTLREAATAGVLNIECGGASRTGLR